MQCALQYAKQLADDLREKIKALGYDRHKLVVQVMQKGVAEITCVTCIAKVHLAWHAGHTRAEEGTGHASCFQVSLGHSLRFKRI